MRVKKKSPGRVGIARKLRKTSTDAENLLWGYLRSKQLAGYKFKRQEPVDNYIADFVCYEVRIIIEVDGGHHALRETEDKKRDEYIKSNGFKVLRFWNNEVLGNIEGVLETIRGELLTPPSP